MSKMEKTLEFKWSVSRGRDTYGYNICSLIVDGVRVARCSGGGYDMKGTILGDYIAIAFKDELLKLKDVFYGLSFRIPNYDPGAVIIEGKTITQREKEGLSLGLERYQAFHAATSKVPTEKHTIPLIDGATGFSSVEKIVNAIGYKLKYIKDGIYLLTPILF
jgi:hypothetical protein